MHGDTPAAAGWFGKLPVLGDFAARRLDAGFVRLWDEWLAAGMAEMQRLQPQDWLAAHLASPSWRFLLMPGVLPGAAGSQAWAGVLMPSVDRVGRYFPFTAVAPVGDGPRDAQQLQALWQWLARLDDLARDALHEDWPVEQLEQALAACPAPGPDAAAAPSAAGPGPALGQVQAQPAGDPVAAIAAQALSAWALRATGQAWWHARPDEGEPRLLVSQGLPSARALAALLGGTATI